MRPYSGFLLDFKRFFWTLLTSLIHAMVDEEKQGMKTILGSDSVIACVCGDQKAT